jgi:hypothetical protein
MKNLMIYKWFVLQVANYGILFCSKNYGILSAYLSLRLHSSYPMLFKHDTMKLS